MVDGANRLQALFRVMEDMTPRQRLLTTLQGGQPDRVPILEFPFNLDLYDAFVGYRPR